jgi:hypothetical protein
MDVALGLNKIGLSNFDELGKPLRRLQVVTSDKSDSDDLPRIIVSENLETSL